jgi:hypothetical protein
MGDQGGQIKLFSRKAAMSLAKAPVLAYVIGPAC